MKNDVLNRTKVKRGSELPWSKLTDDDVRLIRELVAERDYHRRQAAALTNEKIADKFGVHVRTIDRVTSGENWGHVA
jgi:ribosome-binding protein aMBF1 (putative translation factor)